MDIFDDIEHETIRFKYGQLLKSQYIDLLKSFMYDYRLYYFYGNYNNVIKLKNILNTIVDILFNDSLLRCTDVNYLWLVKLIKRYC